MKVKFELKPGCNIPSKLIFVKWIKEEFCIGIKEAKRDVCDILMDKGIVEIDEKLSPRLFDINREQLKKIKESFEYNDFGDNGAINFSIGVNEMREAKLYRVLGGNDRMLNAIIEAVNYKDRITEEDEVNLTIADVKKKIIEEIYNKYKL